MRLSTRQRRLSLLFLPWLRIVQLFQVSILESNTLDVDMEGMGSWGCKPYRPKGPEALDLHKVGPIRDASQRVFALSRRPLFLDKPSLSLETHLRACRISGSSTGAALRIASLAVFDLRIESPSTDTSSGVCLAHIDCPGLCMNSSTNWRPVPDILPTTGPPLQQGSQTPPAFSSFRLVPRTR